MPSSYLSQHHHLIFSTKHREPTLAPSFAPRVYDHLGGILRGLGGVLLAAGGMPDQCICSLEWGRLDPSRTCSAT